MATEPSPPPRPRLGGRGSAILGVAGFVGALAIFALALVAVRAVPNPLAGDAPASAAASVSPGPSRLPKSARFATQGDCVINNGSGEKPDMMLVTCAPDAFDVLERIEGTTDVTQCEKIAGYKFHYFYDSELGDKFDFVLCLRKRPG